MSSYPAEAEQLFYDGTRRMAAGDAAGAEADFRRALALVADFSEAHANLGLLFDQAGRDEEAEKHYRQAIETDPARTQNHLNFGGLLLRQKRFAEAEAAYRQALALNPESASAWSNLGVLLACVQREAEAEQCYRTAMQLDPAYRLAPFNFAYLLLRQGRFEEGWACLERRDWYAILEKNLSFPRWCGESLAGKSLLIGFEAGHGDMIQFCRYAALAKAAGATRVTILCHPGLKRLFATLTGVDDAFAFDEPLPSPGWDYWTPVLSLPFHFKTRLDSIPADLPYLFAKPERIAHWAAILGGSSGERRVGLVWKGNPRFENDADRSLPSLATLLPLWDVPGVRFFSLQKGTGQEEAACTPQAQPLTDLGSGLGDFADTAAVVMNLDLVITVDTAVAHLAGALGKPCWVLLPDYKTDWRWLTGRTDSPWYPGVLRLFRQNTAGDWGAVIEEVKSALNV